MKPGQLDQTDYRYACNKCPFCGLQPVFENTATEAVIRCAPCRVSMTESHAPKNDAKAIERVRNRWNNRD